jgi:hypothetical protein
MKLGIVNIFYFSLLFANSFYIARIVVYALEDQQISITIKIGNERSIKCSHINQRVF